MVLFASSDLALALSGAVASGRCDPEIVCNPASGSVFVAGTTQVISNGINGRGDCNFTVTVSPGLHAVHGHISSSPSTHIGNTHEHHGQHGHTAPPTSCIPHVPGHSPGLAEDTAEGLFRPAGPEASSAVPEFPVRIGQDGATGVLSRGTLLNLFGAANGLFLDNQNGEETAAAVLTPRAAGPIYYTTELPRVLFGEVEAQVVFSGLAPGLKGVWQISVVVPERAPTGEAVPLRVVYEDEETDPVAVAVK